MPAQKSGQDGIKRRIVEDRAGFDGRKLPQHLENVEHVLELPVHPVRRMVGDAVDEGQGRRARDGARPVETQKHKRQTD